MAISGLFVLLSSDDDASGGALRTLSCDPRLTLGERFGRRIAVVAETSSAEGDAALWHDLLATRGIESVDVTFVSIDADFSETADVEPAGSSHDGHR